MQQADQKFTVQSENQAVYSSFPVPGHGTHSLVKVVAQSAAMSSHMRDTQGHHQYSIAVQTQKVKSDNADRPLLLVIRSALVRRQMVPVTVVELNGLLPDVKRLLRP